MGVMLGFFAGYVMGARAGQQGLEDLVGTLKQILGSGELKELVSGGLGLLGEALQAGTKVMGERNVPAIRRVA